MLLLAFLPLQLLLPTAMSLVARDRQYILVLDAGSTGTRINVFTFRPDSNHSTGLRIEGLDEEKVNPGLSAFANALPRLRENLKPLMDFAAAKVPVKYHAETSVIVRATAGLRLLTPKQLDRVVRAVAEILRRSSFLVSSSDRRAVRVISGQEEAEYGWVAVNFLMDSFDKPGGETYGMLDLGGGSTQITFVPKIDNPDDKYRKVFKTVRGKSYALHEHSYLGLGMSQAALYMFGHNSSALTKPLYTSPCLNPAYTSTFSFGTVSINVSGQSGVSSSERHRLCSEVARIPLSIVPVHQPPGIRVGNFVAISSYYYTAAMLNRGGFLNNAIPGNAKVGELAEAAQAVCIDPPVKGQYQPYLCMNSVYVVTLLREGYMFAENQTLFITDSIRGYSASWPLGIAIHQLTCHDGNRLLCHQNNGAAKLCFGLPQLLMLLLLGMLLRPSKL